MATQLTGASLVACGDLTSNTSTPQEIVGTRVATPGGREFVYVLAGGSTLVPGTLVQSPAETTGWENLSVAAAVAGATSITTTSTVTMTANQAAGGWVTVASTPGQGYMYKINHHAAATGAVVTLYLEDPIQVALTTGSKIDVIASPYSGVIINPSSTSGTPVGVATYPITNACYGWIQTKGPTTILSDGGTAVGLAVCASNGTAGAVETLAGTQAPVGIAMTGVSTTDYGFFNINL